MGIEQVIEKVRKLRALAAKAGTLAEAEAAAAQAEAIIARYRLDEAQLELDDAGRQEPINAEDEPLWVGGPRADRWRGVLAGVLSKHYGCLSFSTVLEGPRGRASAYKIVGRASDVAVVRYMFAWLGAEIERLSYRERGRSAMNAFRLGATSGLQAALQATQEAAAGPGEAGAAMVLVNRADEAAAYAAQVFKLRDTGQIRFRDGGAYARGQAAGERMPLGDALGEGSTTRRLN